MAAREAWRANDFQRLRSVLADDIQFSGPLAQLNGAGECVRGLERMSEIKADIVSERMLSDGADVLSWFELHFNVASPVPVASWAHVKDGRITSLRVTFDPRPIAPSG